MEKDTVLLSVEKYNELRDFKKETEEARAEGKSYVISETLGGYIGNYEYSKKYFTDSEIVEDFDKRNKELEAKIKELEAKIEKAKIKEHVEISINDLKKMSYWEFRKWRKS